MESMFVKSLRLCFVLLCICVCFSRCIELEGHCYKGKECSDDDVTSHAKNATYRVIYFNLNGAAEPIRWIFKMAGVPFEDLRIKPEDWVQLRKSGYFPWKEVPLLVIDDTHFYYKATAILRYLGRIFGLVGDDERSNLSIDQAIDILNDGLLAMRRYLVEQNATLEKKVKTVLAKHVFPDILEQVNAIVTSTEGDFIVGNKITWGDLALAHWYQVWEKLIDPRVLKNFPALIKQKVGVLFVPEIQAWILQRPKAPM